jgi:ubiquinone/menaquinone biosynthesis C-methylase UbiE
MSINFKEQVNSLETRIKIHDTYGSKNIDKWMLNKLNLKNKKSILDLGCGDGKQIIAINSILKNRYKKKNYKIFGIDEHKNLIKNANLKIQNKNIKFKIGNFDKKLPFKNNSFDLIISSFAIYYASNINNTLFEIKRVLKENGQLFFMGPMPNNKFEFNEIVEKAANKKIPNLIGSSRFSSEIFQKVFERFDNAKIDVFKNELIFDNYIPFFDYTKSALEKKRGVYKNFFKGKNQKLILDKIENIMKNRFLKQGSLKMTKFVGGITAFK